MTFTAAKLSLSKLWELLALPVITSWKLSSCWSCTRTKEAIPLPLAVVQALEEAFSDTCGEDRWFLGALLVAVWGGLRWSDLQRVDLASLVLWDNAVCGWCWRTKSSKKGMPFALVRCGLKSADWGLHVFNYIVTVRASSPLQDFWLAYNGHPMSYSMALPQFRRVLCCYAALTQDEAMRFTLHSLKATLLCWAGSSGVEETAWSAQGHHRAAGASGCVAKYSRDDVVPQLRCQRVLLKALAEGWVPHIPLERGMERLHLASQHHQVTGIVQPGPSVVREAGEVADDSSATSHSDSDSDSGASSDTECVSDLDAEEEKQSGWKGPWMLNVLSGIIAHRACMIQGKKQAEVALACRPGACLHDGYQQWDTDPCLVGFMPCRHRGCHLAVTSFDS